MPTVCTSIKVSKDGQFILAAGETSTNHGVSPDFHSSKVTQSLHRLGVVFLLHSFKALTNPGFAAMTPTNCPWNLNAVLIQMVSQQTRPHSVWHLCHTGLYLLNVSLSLSLPPKVVAFDILSDDYSKVRNVEPSLPNTLHIITELIFYFWSVLSRINSWDVGKHHITFYIVE